MTTDQAVKTAKILYHEKSSIVYVTPILVHNNQLNNLLAFHYLLVAILIIALFLMIAGLVINDIANHLN